MGESDFLSVFFIIKFVQKLLVKSISPLRTIENMRGLCRPFSNTYFLLFSGLAFFIILERQAKFWQTDSLLQLFQPSSENDVCLKLAVFSAIIRI